MALMKVFKSPGNLASPPCCGTLASPIALEHIISVATCFWSWAAKARSLMTRLKLRRPMNHFIQ
eukprot:10235037-Alexandrium_andersonii.AAC.1